MLGLNALLASLLRIIDDIAPRDPDLAARLIGISWPLADAIAERMAVRERAPVRLDDYAHAHGLATESLAKLIRRGRVPALRVGAVWMLDPVAADAALADLAAASRGPRRSTRTRTQTGDIGLADVAAACTPIPVPVPEQLPLVLEDAALELERSSTPSPAAARAMADVGSLRIREALTGASPDLAATLEQHGRAAFAAQAAEFFDGPRTGIDPRGADA